MKPLEPLKTARDFIDWAVTEFTQAKLFYGHGTDNAEDEALQLVLHALHWSYAISPDALDEILSPTQRQAIVDLVNRRCAEKIPAPYLTHTAYFCGLTFYVDERVIIPRSPFAELIQQQFQPWLTQQQLRQGLQILDLCTGSGCMAIACAHYLPSATLDAVDISADALAVAALNIQRYQLNDRVHLQESDLFINLPPKKYDLIISNPPYVDQRDLETMPDEFSHEPKLALSGGADGLDLVHIILERATDYLTDDGLLIVEVGNSAQALSAHYPQLAFMWLTFAFGGDGVFLLTAEQLKTYQQEKSAG